LPDHTPSQVVSMQKDSCDEAPRKREKWHVRAGEEK
jgi:hypothetical protein